MRAQFVFESVSRFPTFFEVLRWRTEHQPDQRAYTFLVDGESDEVHLTYSQLDSQARSIAAQLQSRKADGRCVLLLYPAGLQYIAAFFGCLYAGAIAVPVYPPRHNHSLDRLQAIVTDSQATVILTTTQIANRLKPLLNASSQRQPLSLIVTDVSDEDCTAQWHKPVIEPDGVAFLQYTSGSTAWPKGAMVSHGNLIHNQLVIKSAFQHTEESTYVSWLPMFHDMGLIGTVLQPLFLGSLGVLMSPTSFVQRPFRWLQAISKYKAHTSGGPNFAFDLCVRKIRPEQRDDLDLSSWRLAFNGAELVRSETIERFSQVFGGCGFQPEFFYPCYGLAEATLLVTGGAKGTRPRVMAVEGSALERRRVVPATDQEKRIRKMVSCGTAWLGQQILIVDPDSLEPCPPDVVGEIWVRGASVVKGYWNRADETKRVFNASLATTGEGPFLRTGDLGFINEGEVFVTGRLKDLIIVHGQNHYAEDIEQTAGQCHPGLRIGCGVAFSVETDNQERLAVVHEIERSYQNWNMEEIAGAIRQAVSDQYELQVYAVVLVEPGSIPKTSSGKLQRYLCRSSFLNNSLNEIARSLLAATDSEDDGTATQTDSFIRKDLLALESDAERRVLLRFYLQEQVAEILRVPASSLNAHQSLTKLGLDSITAAEMQVRLESELGVVFSAAAFLQGITIDSLTSRVLDEMAAPCTPLSHEPAVFPDQADQLLSNIDNLSDLEVDLLLNELQPSEHSS